MSPKALAEVVARGEADRHWHTAARLAIALLGQLCAAPAGTVLNLNVPDADERDIRGVRRTRLARFGQVQMSVAQAGQGAVRVALGDPDEPPEPGSDLAMLGDRYATVTPLRSLTEAREVSLDLTGLGLLGRGARGPAI
jgi:5'-nucleotidase